MLQNRIPHLPFEAYIDITYRCNNSCRHCWLWLPKNAKEKGRELNLDEIKCIADEARALGTQSWNISGGEPMLRPDFSEIFDYLTRKAVTYSLNTNGTLINLEIAKLLKRKGCKMIALYGADAETHDKITRSPGSFNTLMQGIAYLKETGAGFMVQIIPMRSNWHQYNEMLKLAESLSPQYRVGAAWLFMSANRCQKKNREIEQQRLSPKDVITLDPPLPAQHKEPKCFEEARKLSRDNNLIFSSCIQNGDRFHLDPYGGMSFCPFVKDPQLRYDLRGGSVRDAWEKFIPSLANAVRGDDEYEQNCKTCERRRLCRWCGVYSYLENSRYSSPVEYLCQIAAEAEKFQMEWERDHRRYYEIGGMTVQLDSDLPLKETTYISKFKRFEVKSSGEEMIRFHLHFEIPELKKEDLTDEVYRKTPWAIYKKPNSWLYLGISENPNNPYIHRVVVFSQDHTRADIYYDRPELFLTSTHETLTLFPSDQIVFARVLPERGGFVIHAAGMIIDGQGLAFIGQSEAGKSTMVKLLEGVGEILNDENNIIRRWPDGFHIHGTWSHGDVPIVSNGHARLRALLFLKKSTENKLEPIASKSEVVNMILPRLIKPLLTSDWWHKSMDTVCKLVEEVPAFWIKFDQSGEIGGVLRNWLASHHAENGGKGDNNPRQP